MEVEEFNHLSPEVAKERLRKLATKMDRNLDGKMDKSELQVKLENPSFVLIIFISRCNTVQNNYIKIRGLDQAVSKNDGQRGVIRALCNQQ